MRGDPRWEQAALQSQLRGGSRWMQLGTFPLRTAIEWELTFFERTVIRGLVIRGRDVVRTLILGASCDILIMA